MEEEKKNRKICTLKNLLPSFFFSQRPNLYFNGKLLETKYSNTVARIPLDPAPCSIWTLIQILLDYRTLHGLLARK